MDSVALELINNAGRFLSGLLLSTTLLTVFTFCIELYVKTNTCIMRAIEKSEWKHQYDFTNQYVFWGFIIGLTGVFYF